MQLEHSQTNCFLANIMIIINFWFQMKEKRTDVLYLIADIFSSNMFNGQLKEDF